MERNVNSVPRCEDKDFATAIQRGKAIAGITDILVCEVLMAQWPG